MQYNNIVLKKNNLLFPMRIFLRTYTVKLVFQWSPLEQSKNDRIREVATYSRSVYPNCQH